MNPTRKRYTRERGIGRRKEDWLLREHLHQYTQLFHVGQIITSEIDMEVLFWICRSRLTTYSTSDPRRRKPNSSPSLKMPRVSWKRKKRRTHGTKRSC